MNKIIHLQVLTALLAVVAWQAAMAQTNFFSDNFSHGSTVDSASPVKPTTNSTSYEVCSAKAWSPTPSIASSDLRVGIASTSSGILEVQGLFIAPNPVTLLNVGDYVQLVITFTNTSGLLGSGDSSYFGFGLYNSSQVLPYPGGMNGNLTTASSYVGSGWAQGWQGYWAQVAYSGGASRIEERPAQTGSDNRNQDLVTSGSGSMSYGNPAASTIGSQITSSLVLNTGATYTVVFTITLNGTSSLAITNALYSGPNTNGTLLTQYGGVASGSSYLTSSFDALAAGFYQKSSGPTNCIDIASISVSGQGATSPVQPVINTQPGPATVATNGSCMFYVNASGIDMTYQWHRNNTNLNAGGNISVVNSQDGTGSMLVISSAGPADQILNTNNGYYVTITSGIYSTNSVTNVLTLVPVTNLTWTGSANNQWDVDTTVNWQDTNGNPAVFTCGDPVTFDNTAGGGTVVLTCLYLGAASVTVSHTSSFYTFTNNGGVGSFAGPGELIYNGSGLLTINNANTYSGGTIISNASANLRLGNFGGLGTGPVTLALAGGQMEIIPTGSSSSGIGNDFIVADDFTIVVDATNSSYGVVLNGNLSGTTGKTLTLNHSANGSGTTPTRIRASYSNVVYNANLNLNDSMFLWAPYGDSQTYSGVISGSGALMQKGAMAYFNNTNTYSGGMNISSGAIGLGTNSFGNPVTSGPIGIGPLLLTVDSTTSTTGSGEVFAFGGDRTLGNPIQYPTGTNNLTLIIGGTNNLTLSGAFTLNGNDNVTTNAITMRTIQVTNTAPTIISGVISDGGLVYGLNKTSNGVLYLDGANTYTGPTTNSAGTLAGAGSVTSSVFVQTNAAIGGGSAAAIGTFTISGGLTLNGNVFARVNKSLSPSQSNDVVSVSGVLTNMGTGTVTVTNLGPALVAGNKFKLFNKALTGGGSLTVIGGGLTVTWSNGLAVDGSISVLSVVAPHPVITNTMLVNGTNLVFSGTNGIAGVNYYVLYSTNLATPLSNWMPILTNTFITGGNFSVTNPIVPGDPDRFYLLQLPP